jgi:hypothetical protein
VIGADLLPKLTATLSSVLLPLNDEINPPSATRLVKAKTINTPRLNGEFDQHTMTHSCCDLVFGMILGVAPTCHAILVCLKTSNTFSLKLTSQLWLAVTSTTTTGNPISQLNKLHPGARHLRLLFFKETNTCNPCSCRHSRDRFVTL